MATAWPQEAITRLSGAAAGFVAAGPDAVASALLPNLVGRGEQAALWLAKWQAQPNERLARAMSVLTTADDIQARLARITSPTLVVHVEHDPLIPADAGRALSRQMAEPADFVVLAGAAHTPDLNSSGPVGPLLEKFLSSKSRRPLIGRNIQLRTQDPWHYRRLNLIGIGTATHGTNT
jgi:3-oxoadipate enol-lactonase